MDDIIIERVTTQDAGELLEIYAPYVRNTAISFEYEVPALQEFEDRISTIAASFPYIKAVDCNTGMILGYAYAASFKDRRAYDWSVEVTVYVRQDVRRQGIGARLYGALEEYLQKMGILNMNACIAVTENEDRHLSNASMYFHKRMGFDMVGTFHKSGYKFNTWYDMIWMEKMIGKHEGVQKAVRFGEW